MIPIYEQGTGRGIGHSFESFSQRFESICKKQMEQGRAQAFAFIFYDFSDHQLRQLLRDQGVFAQLDRLSGTRLSLFYLHAGSRDGLAKFNQQFLGALGVASQAKLPCVVFFRVNSDQIEGIEIVQLDSSNLIHGFKEIYEVIDQYLATGLTTQKEGSRVLVWFKSAAKFVSTEVFRMILKKSFESIF